ncbi:radical SAM/SPASM domain-containing protein [Streptomyces sannanensis]|uniref:Radical SAM/SPASM domain-containing protein n=2 Tax=Streptomyces sannanensis TaxID=285536 RepID=A0ABP6SBZ5_9ACTN
MDKNGSAIPIWDRFPSHERLAVNFTLTCNLACAHCIVESSPQRTERLTPDEVKSALTTAKSSGKKHVTFSGGEVFLFHKDMTEVIAFARSHGYVVDVETNGFWARNDTMARDRLAPFVEAGISGLSVSADAYHVHYFPVERAINAVRAGRSYGLLTEINFCPSTEQETDAQIIAALEEANEPFIHNELLIRGRGKDLIQLGDGRPVTELPDCDSLTTTVHATGDVYACCELDISTDAMKRTPVFLGPIQSAPAEMAKQQRREALVQEFYNPDSPIYFRKMIDSHPLFTELGTDRYQSICDLCMKALGDPKRIDSLLEMLNERSATP